MPVNRATPDDQAQEEFRRGEEIHGEATDPTDESRSPEQSGEPDEPGEGAFTRSTVSGGFEPRVLSDHDDPTLAEQMAPGMRPIERWRAREDAQLEEAPRMRRRGAARRSPRKP